MTTYTLEEKNDYIAIRFQGDITLEYSFDFKEKIKEQLASLDCYRVIVNLTDVEFMDSSGLGMLISLFKETNEKKGQIVYFGVHDYIHKLFALVKLDQVFKIADSEEEAAQMVLA